MEHFVLVAGKIAVLVLGSAITALALLAFRRTGQRLMLYLGLGFGLVTVGSTVEGVLFESLGWDLAAVHVLESLFVLGGLGWIAALLRPRRFAR